MGRLTKDLSQTARYDTFPDEQEKQKVKFITWYDKWACILSYVEFAHMNRNG